jgi:2'-5' RNA ligase
LPGTGVIRAFFAIELGEPARRAAADVARRLREGPGGDGVRWVRPEALHVTLRFLGDVDSDRLAPLASRAARELAALRPFALRLGRAELFPTPSRPRVVALGLEPAAPLAEVAGAVERAVVAEGFAPEERPFRAHLTLGRVRAPQAKRAARRGRAEGGPERAARRGPGFPSLAALEVPAAEIAVEEAVLFQSELSPEGSRYTPLERLRLRGGKAAERPRSEAEPSEGGPPQGPGDHPS